MATAPLIPTQIEAVFQAITLAIPGLALTQSEPGNQFSSVRIGWQTQGQPAESVDENIIYIRCTEDDDAYDKTRDEKITGAGNRVVTYVRVWRCIWSIVGPGSFDNARIIRSAVLNDQATHDRLAGAKLYAVTNPSAPQRLVQPFPGNLWQERVDFEVQYNEGVTEAGTVGTVRSTEVVIETETANQELTVETVQLPSGSYGSGGYGKGPYGGNQNG